MENTMQLRQSAIEKINSLPREKLKQVMDFIDFVGQARGPGESASSTLPAPDAFLDCAGTWEFEPGELQQILHEIEQARNLELEA